MNRQQLRTLSVILFPLAAIFGCAEEDSVDVADESTETGEDSDSPDEGDDSDDGDELPNRSGDDDAPTVQIMLDGEADPVTLRSASDLKLLAQAEDPSGINMVEFYLDDQLISSDAQQPYRTNLPILDASFNGEHSLIARAYDSNGNMAESSLALSVALPESGTLDWEYIGAGAGPRWVSVGAEDSALVVGARDMARISTVGTLLSQYTFTYDVSAVTSDRDGGLIAVGTIGGTLVIQRFTNEGVPLYLDLIEEFGTPEMSITEVAVGEDGGSLVISSVDQSPIYVVPTARISSVAIADAVTLEWHHDLLREAQPTSSNHAARVSVAPNGVIYTTPTFDAGPVEDYVQLRQIEQDGDVAWTFEDLIPEPWSYQDVAATDHAVFVAGRLDDQSAIARFDTHGEPHALYYVGAGTAVAIESAGEELVYASVLPDASTKVGRISKDGEERWSKQFGGNDNVRDIALTSIGHMYMVSEWPADAWRLRRIHP